MPSKHNPVGLIASIDEVAAKWQLRTSETIINWWEARTNDHTSLYDTVEGGFQAAGRLLGDHPDFAVLAFEGSVERGTGKATLTHSRQFSGQTITEEATSNMMSMPTIHVGNIEAGALCLAEPSKLNMQVITPENPVPTGQDEVRFGLIELGDKVALAEFVRNTDVPDGTVLPSAGQHARSHRRVNEQSLSESLGIRVQLGEILRTQGKIVPSHLLSAYNSNSRQLDSQLVRFITNDPQHEFSKCFLDSYGQSLGDLFIDMQLHHCLDAIFVTGSLGRVPGFLELVVESDSFLNTFMDEPDSALYDQRDALCIARITDEDLVLQGAYQLARRRFLPTFCNIERIDQRLAS